MTQAYEGNMAKDRKGAARNGVKSHPRFNFDKMAPGDSFYHEGARNTPVISYGYAMIKGLYQNLPAGNGWKFRLKTDEELVNLPEGQTIYLHIQADSELLEKLDHWRKQHSKILSRTEAIKHLIDKGISSKHKE